MPCINSSPIFFELRSLFHGERSLLIEIHMALNQLGSTKTICLHFDRHGSIAIWSKQQSCCFSSLEAHLKSIALIPRRYSFGFRVFPFQDINLRSFDGHVGLGIIHQQLQFSEYPGRFKNIGACAVEGMRSALGAPTVR